MSTDRPTNPHRGSDFNEFLTEHRLMPTPRTDAIAHSGHNESIYIARMTYLARELERELAEARKQLADWQVLQATTDHDLADVRKSLAFQIQLNRELIEREKQAHCELSAERALADRLKKAAQALVDRWETLFWKDVPHTGKFIRSLEDALAAWKGARRE